MKRLHLMVTCCLFWLVTGSARAGGLAVTDYNWLQLPPTNVTASIGGTSGSGGSGWGAPADFRWGNYVWIPDAALTGSGTGDYWAQLEFDTARSVKNVWVQWWANEGTGIRRFHVEGSLNGTTWTNIGSYDYGSMQTGARIRANVSLNVTSEWKCVRVRFNSGDYQYASQYRGGPGLCAIEPMGDGTVESHVVNWANQGNFGTAVQNNGLGYNGTRYVDGLIFDDESGRTGCASDQIMASERG